MIKNPVFIKEKSPSCNTDNGVGAAETGGEPISYKAVAGSQVRDDDSLSSGNDSEDKKKSIQEMLRKENQLITIRK